MLTVLLAIFASTVIAAEKKMYVGFGVFQQKVKVSSDNLGILKGDSGSLDDSKKTLSELRFGYMFNKNIGIDLTYGLGTISKSVDITSTRSTTMDFGPRLAIYAKGVWNPNEQFGLYGLLGWKAAKVDVRSIDSTTQDVTRFNDTKSGIAYGVGLSYNIGDVVVDAGYRMNDVELKQDSTKSKLSGRSFVLGIGYRF